MALKIEIEGTDGAGKTTAFEYITKKLKDQGKEVLETREVGSPLIPVNVELRKTVLDPESNLDGKSMELIFSAMRLENERYYSSVRDQYDLIVSDRGWLSHLAYTDHNVSKKFTEDLYINFLRDLTNMPDVVIYLDIDSKTALQRRVGRGEEMDVIEQKGVEYQEKVRQSFDKYIKDIDVYSPGSTVFTVDANLSEDEVKKQLDDIINTLLKGGINGKGEVSRGIS